MNSLARKLSIHPLFSFPFSGRRMNHLRPMAALQQCSSYSTKTPRTTTKRQQIQKSAESSPSFSHIITEKPKMAPSTVWPQPSEIPFQAKVANFVNLIGYVKIPVHFESDSDGKYYATTALSLGGGGERNPLLIPVVFEGDLAHIAACHVKEGDYVFVSGQLSVGPLKVPLIEKHGKIHVVAENLNFVEGFRKRALDTKIGVGSWVEKLDNVDSSWVEKLDNVDSDDADSKKKWCAPPLGAPTADDADSKPLPKVAQEPAISEHVNVDISLETGGNKRGFSGSKKKSADEVWDLWRDLVKNPLLWWDYREHKANGMVKEKYPDFKQKDSEEALWIDGAPKWVLPGLGKLVCDVKNLNFKPKQVPGGGDNRSDKFKNEDLWKSLVENPSKWWDNRANKKNPKAPDFKHKETGDALWLRGSPDWVLSKLPPAAHAEN